MFDFIYVFLFDRLLIKKKRFTFFTLMRKPDKHSTGEKFANQIAHSTHGYRAVEVLVRLVFVRLFRHPVIATMRILQRIGRLFLCLFRVIATRTKR